MSEEEAEGQMWRDCVQWGESLLGCDGMLGPKWQVCLPETLHTNSDWLVATASYRVEQVTETIQPVSSVGRGSGIGRDGLPAVCHPCHR